MKTILVIDDEESFLLALELLLQSEGYNILTATTGEEGLLKIKDGRPDLVLLDNMMPGMGGLETLKKVKALPQFKKMPILLMSGSRPNVKQSEYGWSGFLFKPFGLDELLSAIKSALG